MSSNRTLTVQELDNFLHNMNQCSPFVDVASSFASQDKSFQQPFDVDYMASLMRGVLPAAGAVLGESPMMGTPYLDPSMTPYTPCTPYTPFTPATAFTPITDFTPSLEAMQDSPHFSPCMESNDIQITPYLANSTWLTGSSSSSPASNVPAFSGDPSQLLLAKSEDASPPVDVSYVQSVSTSTHLGWQDEPPTETSDNMLFPPLDDDDVSLGYGNTAAPFDHQESEIFNAFSNFDFSGAEATQQQQQTMPASSNGDSDSSSSNNHGNSDQEQSLQKEESSGASSGSKKRRSTMSEPDAKRQRSNNTGSDKKYECDVCKARFNRRYNLGTHIKTHNKNRIKAYTCNVCTKGFDRRHDRERHIATVHNGERSFTCNNCSSSFSRKDALTRHLDHKHGIV